MGWLLSLSKQTKGILIIVFSMNKKILLITFTALFIIPEILWSPLLNAIYNFFNSGSYLRDTNFLSFSNSILSFIFFLETAGLIGVTTTIFNYIKLSTGIKKLLFILSFLLLALLSLVSLFFLWASFAYRSIGF